MNRGWGGRTGVGRNADNFGNMEEEGYYRAKNFVKIVLFKTKKFCLKKFKTDCSCDFLHLIIWNFINFAVTLYAYIQLFMGAKYINVLY